MVNRIFATFPPLAVEDPSHPASIVFPAVQPPPPPIGIAEVSALESGPSGRVVWGLVRRKEEKAAAGYRQSEMLESIETPTAPIQSFQYK